MKAFRKYLKDGPEEEAAPPAKSTSECVANGCPLPGVFGQTGSHSSLCCVHDEEDPKDWAEQTTRARNRLKLFHLAFDMTNAESGEPMPQRARDKIVAIGGCELPGQTIRICGAQLKSLLIRECKGPKVVPALVKQRLDTWRSLREVV